MKRIIVVLSFVAALFVAAGLASAGETAAPLSTPELKKIIGSGKKNTVVFFINPMGGPCNAQKQILEKLHKDRRGNFNIAFVSTMNQADQQAFYDYGIRSLPTLVIVNKNGKIAHFFPPGIQPYETLAATLDQTK